MHIFPPNGPNAVVIISEKLERNPEGHLSSFPENGPWLWLIRSSQNSGDCNKEKSREGLS